MAKPKNLEQLRAEKEQVETQLAQEQHKLERLENRKKYLEKGERQKRTHRLCNLGGTIESLAPEFKDLTRTEMTELMEYIFSLPEVQRAVRHMAITLGQNVPKLDALYLMDGIEGLRSLPKHSVDMLLTDPPYGTTRNFWDVPLPLPELWEAVRWAVKPNGAILFFAQCPFDKVLGASNLAMLRYEWVWYRSRATGFLNANRAPLKKSENILVFYQKSPVYHPQFTYGEPYRKINPRSGCSTNYGKFERTGSESNDGRRYPGNVLFVPTVTGGVHPTQKPVELCEYFIKTYTDEGAVVADICAGSGTTAVAAMNTGRRFICFENAPSIYTVAAQRIERARLVVAGGGKGE